MPLRFVATKHRSTHCTARARVRLQEPGSRAGAALRDRARARACPRSAGRTGSPAEDVVAVCVGLPSPVDQATGRALNPVGMHGWTGEDVRAQIAEVFDGPVLVDNDVNLMAYGERTFVYPEAQDLIFVKLATGVGAGVIAGGALQRGAQGFAGDIGHVPLLNSDRPCPCGNTGCVSLTASVPGLAASLREAGRELETDAEVVDLVAQGDPEAQRLLRQAGRDVGDVMVAAVGLLNPSRLVIGGPWGPGFEVLIAGVRETVYGRGFAPATRQLRIEASRTPDMAAIHGAAALAVEAAIGI
ncbi:ROK family protein [Brachybacterium halotolerans]|uniref:ROK family protein n=1 Tax=Brachybacterium halotolerans TaxID=2795215 RepID=UPI001FEB2DBD|nr:ROK family protein [Brachybacterium halotolerans]